jgi:hypothetical protein
MLAALEDIGPVHKWQTSVRIGAPKNLM